MPSTPPAERRPIDGAAIVRTLQRLAAHPEAPWLHAEVARRMADRLAVIRLQPERVVEWWGVAGASDEPLRAAYPRAARVVVEPTQALGEVCREQRKAPWWTSRRWAGPTVEVVAGDLSGVTGAQLLWANMVLHASIDPPNLIAAWHRALAVDGFVMFSCLGPDSLKELRAVYRELGWGDAAAEFIDMHDIGDMLVRAGFADPVMDQEQLTLTWASSEALLAELRGLGANASPQRFAGLRTPRWRARLLAALQDRLAGPDGRLALTLEVSYGHAFKGAPKLSVQPTTTVSLDDMRSLVKQQRPREK